MRTIKLILLLFCPAVLFAQTHTEKITREFTFEKKSAANALMIANINGSIKIEAYNGDKILVEVNKQIKGKTDARLEKGKQEIQLGVVDLADTLILYVDGLCSGFGRKTKKSDNWSGKNWGYNWSDCNNNNCRQEYDYRMDFSVKVPASLHVLASTVNNGDIEIHNIKGTVIANNVNGHIKLMNLMRESEAHTINGNVDVEYSANPNEYCRFYTLNGDINAWFQKGLAANLSFQSFNGNFYTNIDKLERLPLTVEKKPTGDGIKYKVSSNRYKIGNGGALLDFETFNGNVYLKERVN